MRKLMMTRELAWAASMDAGNRAMQRGARTAWSEEDYNEAARTFDRLWPVENDYAEGELSVIRPPA